MQTHTRIIFVLLCLLPLFTKAQNLEQDSLALIEIYNSLNGSAWCCGNNWLTTDSVSNWNGVAITNDRVTSLDISYCCLSGTVSNSIVNLTALANLDISNNALNFENLEPLINHPNFNEANFLNYGNQNIPPFSIEGSNVACYDKVTILQISDVGAFTKYEWKKDGVSLTSGSIGDDFYYFVVSSVEDGGVYTLELTHDNFPDLHFISDSLEITVLGIDRSGSVYPCDEIIVTFDSTTTEAYRNSVREALNVELLHTCNCGTPLEIWKTDVNHNPDPNTVIDREVMETLCVDNNGFGPNYSLEFECLPFPNSLPALEATPGNSGDPLIIAMIDTGIKDSAGLEDFILCPEDTCNTEYCGIDFLYGDNPGADSNNVHASYMTIFALNEIAPEVDVRLLNYKVFNSKEKGNLFEAVCAIYKAMESGADIINTSWSYQGNESRVLKNALNKMQETNTIMVTAAGNGIEREGQNISSVPFYPAANSMIDSLDNNSLVTVATFQIDSIAYFSNYSDTLVHFAAPGWQITLANGVIAQSGTSYSTAFVTAWVAGIKHKFPGISKDSIFNVLQSGTDSISGVRYGKLDTLSASYNIQHVACGDSSLGSIDVRPSGGIPPYNYSWSNDSTSAIIDGLTQSNYSITLTDLIGNEIIDTINIAECPLISACPDDIVIINDSSFCFATITIDQPMVSFNVDSIVNDYNNTDLILGEQFPLGETVIIWTANDESGNTSTCKTIVRVLNDYSAYGVTGITSSEDISVQCYGQVPEMTTQTWMNNCYTGTVTGTDQHSGGCPLIINREWIYTGGCGESASTSQRIVVNDTIAPVLDSAPANTTVSCFGYVPPMIGLGWTDNCSGASTVSGSDFYSGSCPTVITRIWATTDACGNSTSTHQIIVVNDITLPALSTPPADTVLNCPQNTIPAMTVLNWTDNCDGAGTVTGVDSGNHNNCPTEITRTWSYTDSCGNWASASQTIILVDTPGPGPNAQSIPTLSQWGLILFALLLLTGTSMSLMPNPATVAVGKIFNVGSISFVFDVELYKRILLKGLPIMGIAFLFFSWVEGGFFVNNLLGVFIGGLILAYLMYYILLSEKLK